MIQIIALLYAGEGGKAALQAYEAKAAPIFDDHGGHIVSASHAAVPREDDPDEIHIVQFSDMAALEAYRADPRHAALQEERLYAVRDTRVFLTDRFQAYID